MSFIRYKKIGNKEYAYEVISYYDKVKKALEEGNVRLLGKFS